MLLAMLLLLFINQTVSFKSMSIQKYYKYSLGFKAIFIQTPKVNILNMRIYLFVCSCLFVFNENHFSLPGEACFDTYICFLFIYWLFLPYFFLIQ